MTDPFENEATSEQGRAIPESTQVVLYDKPSRVFYRHSSEDLKQEERVDLVPIQAVDPNYYQFVTQEAFFVASALRDLESSLHGQWQSPDGSGPWVPVPAVLIRWAHDVNTWAKQDRVEALNHVEYMCKHFSHTNFARAMWLICMANAVHTLSDPRWRTEFYQVFLLHHPTFANILPVPIENRSSTWVHTQQYKRWPLPQGLRLRVNNAGMQLIFKRDALLQLHRVYLGQQASWVDGAKNTQATPTRRYWAMLFPHTHELFGKRTVARNNGMLNRRQLSWKVKRYACPNRICRRAYNWHTCLNFMDILPQRIENIFPVQMQVGSRLPLRKRLYARFEKRLRRGRRLRGVAKRKWHWIRLWARNHTSSLYAFQRYRMRYVPNLHVMHTYGEPRLILPGDEMRLTAASGLSKQTYALHNALCRTFAPYSLKRKWHYRIYNQTHTYGNLMQYIGSDLARPARQDVSTFFKFPAHFWFDHNVYVPDLEQEGVQWDVFGPYAFDDFTWNPIASDNRLLDASTAKRMTHFESSANRLAAAWLHDVHNHVKFDMQYISLAFMENPVDRFNMHLHLTQKKPYALFNTMQRQIFREIRNDFPSMLRLDPNATDSDPELVHDVTEDYTPQWAHTGNWTDKPLRTMPHGNAVWILGRGERLGPHVLLQQKGVDGPMWFRGLEPKPRQNVNVLQSLGLQKPPQWKNPAYRRRGRRQIRVGQSDVLKRKMGPYLYPNCDLDACRSFASPWLNPYTSSPWAGRDLSLLLVGRGEYNYRNYDLISRHPNHIGLGFELCRKMDLGVAAEPLGFFAGLYGDEESLIYEFQGPTFKGSESKAMKAPPHLGPYAQDDFMDDWRIQEKLEEDDELALKQRVWKQLPQRATNRRYGYRMLRLGGPVEDYTERDGPWYMVYGDGPMPMEGTMEARIHDPSIYGLPHETVFNVEPYALEKDHGLRDDAKTFDADFELLLPTESKHIQGDLHGPEENSSTSDFWKPWSLPYVTTLEEIYACEKPYACHPRIGISKMPRLTGFKIEPKWPVENISFVTTTYRWSGSVPDEIQPQTTSLNQRQMWVDRVYGGKLRMPRKGIRHYHQRAYVAYDRDGLAVYVKVWAVRLLFLRMIYVYVKRRRFTSWRVLYEFILRMRWFAFDTAFSMHRTVKPHPNYGMERWVDTGQFWFTLRGTLFYLHEERKKRINRILDLRFNPWFDGPNLFEKAPRGFLLVGPPGTGKTLLVKAFAGEARVPILSYGTEHYFPFYDLGYYEDDDELTDEYAFEDGVLESEYFLRSMFHAAKHWAPCVLLIDEIDGVAAKRDWHEGKSIYDGFYGDRGFATDRKLEPNRAYGLWSSRGNHGRGLNPIHDDTWSVSNLTMRHDTFLRTNQTVVGRPYPSTRLSFENRPLDANLVRSNDMTLIRLLTELDGLTSRNEDRRYVVFGATNRPWMLDPALLRSGRLSTVLYLDLPNEQKRFELLQLFVAGQHVEPIDWNRFSKKTILFDPATLDTMVNFSRLRGLLSAKQNGEALVVNHTNATLEYGLASQDQNAFRTGAEQHTNHLESLLAPPHPYQTCTHNASQVQRAKNQFGPAGSVFYGKQGLTPSFLTSAYIRHQVLVCRQDQVQVRLQPDPDLPSRVIGLTQSRWRWMQKHHRVKKHGHVLQQNMARFQTDYPARINPNLSPFIYGWLALERQGVFDSDAAYERLRSVLPENQSRIFVLAWEAFQRLQLPTCPVFTHLLEHTVFGADGRFSYDVQRLFYSVGRHACPSKLAILKPRSSWYYAHDALGHAGHLTAKTKLNTGEKHPFNWHQNEDLLAGLGNPFQRVNWFQHRIYGKEALFARSAYYNAARVLIRYFLPFRKNLPDYDLYESCRSPDVFTQPDKWVQTLYQTCICKADFESLLLDLLSGKVGEQFFYTQRCTDLDEVWQHQSTLGLENLRQANWLMNIMLEHNLFYGSRHDLKRKIYIEPYDSRHGPEIQKSYPETITDDIGDRSYGAHFEWFPTSPESELKNHGNRTYYPYYDDALTVYTRFNVNLAFMAEDHSLDEMGTERFHLNAYVAWHRKKDRTEQAFEPWHPQWQHVTLNNGMDMDSHSLSSWHIMNVPCRTDVPFNAQWNRLPKAEQDAIRAGAFAYAHEKISKVLMENKTLLESLSRLLVRFQTLDEAVLFQWIERWIEPRLMELSILPDGEMDAIRRAFCAWCDLAQDLNQSEPYVQNAWENPSDLDGSGSDMPSGADVRGPDAMDMPSGADVRGPDAMD